MKKLLFLVATAIVFGFTSCSEEDCDHTLTSGSDGENVESLSDVMGSWYEEAENEEMRFNANGTFYNKYTNVLRSAETEGRWEYDAANRKLTYTYTFVGQTQFADWTVKDLSEIGFTISSSTVANHKLEKIVETYTLEVGQTANIQFKTTHPTYQITSYKSNNERLASVTADGVIKAEGEKGTTYIKVATNNGNVWVKVVVGADCLDLWYDYVSVLNMDYTQMRETLSRLGEPYAGSDGYSFGFPQTMHDYIETTKVFLDPETELATEIQLQLQEDVPEAKVLSYINSRYYKFAESSDLLYYSSMPLPETSNAVIVYNKSTNCVIFIDKDSFFTPVVEDIYPDLTSLFNKGAQEINTSMSGMSYPYLVSDYSYSVNGSDYYSISGSDYLQMVGFVFNPDDKVSEYWLYLNEGVYNDVYAYLMEKYTEAEDEAGMGVRVFYNKKRTIKITLDLTFNAVIYNSLNMKQHETPKTELLGNYHEGLGKTSSELENLFGIPFDIDANGTYTYFFTNPNVSLGMYRFNASTNKCYTVGLILTDAVQSSEVIEYLNSKYEVFVSSTTTENLRSWKSADKTIGILYNIENKMVQYIDLTVNPAAKATADYNCFK